jgi:hypothetical protein
VTEQSFGDSLPAMTDGVTVRQVALRCRLPPKGLPSPLIFAPTSTASSRAREELGGGVWSLGWQG